MYRHVLITFYEHQKRILHFLVHTNVAYNVSVLTTLCVNASACMK